MLAELQALLTRLDPRPEDHLVFVGDLVDKGPNSIGVVHLLTQMRKAGQRITLVLGNHEDHYQRLRRAGETALPAKTSTFLEQLTSDEVAFLNSAVLYCRLEAAGAVVVHGGIPTTLKDLDAPTKKERAEILRLRHVTGAAKETLTVRWTVAGAVGSEWGALALSLLGAAHKDGPGVPEHERTMVVKRDVTPAGTFIRLGEEKAGDPFWTDVYDGRFGHVFYGHTAYLGRQTPWHTDYASGVDLGAVYGGYLAAWVLEEGQAADEGYCVSVKADKSWAVPYKNEAE